MRWVGWTKSWQRVGDDQLAATWRMLNPDADDSPMSRVRASMQPQIATVLQAMSVLSDKEAGDSAPTAAVKAAKERSTVKG